MSLTLIYIYICIIKITIKEQFTERENCKLYEESKKKGKRRNNDGKNFFQVKTGVFFLPITEKNTLVDHM